MCPVYVSNVRMPGPEISIYDADYAVEPDFRKVVLDIEYESVRFGNARSLHDNELGPYYFNYFPYGGFELPGHGAADTPACKLYDIDIFALDNPAVDRQFAKLVHEDRDTKGRGIEDTPQKGCLAAPKASGYEHDRGSADCGHRKTNFDGIKKI